MSLNFTQVKIISRMKKKKKKTLSTAVLKVIEIPTKKHLCVRNQIFFE